MSSGTVGLVDFLAFFFHSLGHIHGCFVFDVCVLWHPPSTFRRSYVLCTCIQGTLICCYGAFYFSVCLRMIWSEVLAIKSWLYAIICGTTARSSIQPLEHAAGAPLPNLARE